MATPTIQIIIRNHLRISGLPSATRQLLTKRLKFPNPKYIENARMGRWNRGVPKVLKFYDALRGGDLCIPRGYIRQLVDLCKTDRIPYRIDDQRRELPPVQYAFTGKLRQFQHSAVQKMLAKEFGTLSAPTGAGKTVMALYIIAQRRQPALIVVHTKDLAQQWIQRIEQFLNLPAVAVGQIGAGRKRMGEKITVALVQSLYRLADEVSPHVGHIVVDECHRTPSRTFTEAVTEFDCRYMLGLSATPYRRDKLSKLIFWHLGDMHHQIDPTFLVATGDVLAAEVHFRSTEFRPYADPVYEYSKMLSELTSDDERNRLIAADIAQAAQQTTGVCLVLSDRKKHCQSLHALLTYKHHLEPQLLTGDLNEHQRKAVMDRLDNGEIKVLIATGQLIGEGFDSRHLTTLFLATPIRFSGRVIQYLGRVLRPAPGKAKARVYDYVDVHVAPLKKAARARRQIYGPQNIVQSIPSL